MNSPFDPNTFLTLQTDGGFETSFTPVPENEYPAVIDDVKIRVVNQKDGQQRLVADLFWSVLDEAVKAALGMTKVTVRQSCFLDLTPDGRYDRDKNKNIDLGRVRQAVGQNEVAAWSLLMLKGAGPAKIRVTIRPDDRDPTKKYNDVVAVTSFQSAAAA